MKHLLKIIGQDISTLNSLIEHLSEKETLEPIEIELALRKVNDIHNELLMLNPQGDKQWVSLNEPVVAQTHKVEKTVVGDKSTEIAIPKKVVEPEIIETVAETASAIVEPTSSEESLEVSPSIADLTKDQIQPVEEKVVEPEPKKVEPKVVKSIIEHTGEKEVVNEVKVKAQDKEEIDETKTVSKSTIADKFGESAPSLNDIQAGINKHKYLASKYKDKPIAKLSKAIKINDRIWFINELFNQDADEYAKVIASLDAKSNLDEALAYIFESYQWDQEKKSTIGFLELIFRRFAQ